MKTSETTVYKITRPDLTTHNGFRYVVGERYTFSGTGPLCGPGYSHVYTSQGLAVFLNPIHAAYDPFRLWEARGVVAATDHGLKAGCSSIRLAHELEVPAVTLDQRVTFAIYATLAVSPQATFVSWPEAWLAGNHRAATVPMAAAAALATWVAALATWAAKPLDLDAIAAAVLLPWQPRRLVQP